MLTTFNRLILLAVLVLVPGLASAQNFVRVQNYWKGNQFIHVEHGPVTSGPAQSGWWSADWLIERVGDGLHVRFKNRWKSTYLHTEHGGLDVGQIQTGWWSAMWVLENAPAGRGYYRIRNRWTGAYIHVEHGRIEAGPIQPGWHSAMWRLNGY